MDEEEAEYEASHKTTKEHEFQFENFEKVNRTRLDYGECTC